MFFKVLFFFIWNVMNFIAASIKILIARGSLILNELKYHFQFKTQK